MSNNASPWLQLSQRVLNIEQIRAVDAIAVKKYGMHSLVLMENAALGCVQWLRDHYENQKRSPSTPRTVVLCGSGNNGGDGLAISRHLRCWGWPCQVFLLGPPERLTADAQANSQVLLAENAESIVWWDAREGAEKLRRGLAEAELIIDAMLGSGATGDPRAPLDEWIDEANSAQAFRVAIDIPTGVDASTGKRGSPTFSADATLTFVALKPAMQGSQASELFGAISVLPIGIPEPLIQSLLASS